MDVEMEATRNVPFVDKKEIMYRQRPTAATLLLCLTGTGGYLLARAGRDSRSDCLL